MRRPFPVVRSIDILDPELFGLLPEDLAARGPFVLRTSPGLNRKSTVPEAKAELGRRPPAQPCQRSKRTAHVRLCIGLRSTSAQRRIGRWSTREDWAWPELGAALAAMTAEATPGYSVAVVEATFAVSVLPDTRGRVGLVKLRPVGVSQLNSFVWVALRRELLERMRACAVPCRFERAPRLGYVHLREYVRARLGSDGVGLAARLGWRVRAVGWGSAVAGV